MALAAWWRGDSVPELSLFPGFCVEASRDAHLIADITRLAPDEIHQRMHTGHQPYVASMAAGADTCWPPLRPATQPCTCAIELKPAKTRAA